MIINVYVPATVPDVLMVRVLPKLGSWWFGLKMPVAPVGSLVKLRKTLGRDAVDEPGTRLTETGNVFEPVVRTCRLDGAVTVKSKM